MLSRLNEQRFVAPVELLKNETMLFSASPQFALQEGGPLTLEAVTFLLDAGEISLDRNNVVIDDDLIRRPSRRKEPTQSQPMTEELRRILRQEARTNPTIPQATLAAKYGVNPGRVSEALR